ncbi:hypothetical protein FB451DRAFT_1494294 [Mycena latifolia]|nr:hypothetical protein FB451DRAFT_1494294 [Mycena latifolia]
MAFTMNSTANGLRRDIYSSKYIPLEPVDPDNEEPVWGQMLYAGPPSQWMAPEPIEGEDIEPDHSGVEPVFHLPSFLLDPNFTGDANVPRSSHTRPHPPPARQAYPVREAYPVRQTYHHGVPPSSLYVSYALAPQYQQPQYPNVWPDVRKAPLKPSELAPPWPHYNDPAYTMPAPPAPPPLPHMLAPPWPHYNEPRLHALPPSPPPSPPSKYVPPPAAPRVFHPPTPAELNARLEAVRARCNELALAAHIDLAQKARDTAPTAPPPRVFIPPPGLHPSPPPRAASRSPTPFRLLPPLAARFPRYFAGAEAEVDEASDVDSVFNAAGSVDWPPSLGDDDSTVHSTLSERAAALDTHHSTGSACDNEHDDPADGDTGHDLGADADDEDDHDDDDEDEDEDIFWDAPDPDDALE